MISSPIKLIIIVTGNMMSDFRLNGPSVGNDLGDGNIPGSGKKKKKKRRHRFVTVII